MWAFCTNRIWLSRPTVPRSLPVADIHLASMLTKVFCFNCRQRQQILKFFAVSRTFLGPHCLLFAGCVGPFARHSRWPPTAIFVLLLCTETHLPSPLCCQIFSLCVRGNKISVVPYSPRAEMNTLCLYLYCPALCPPWRQSNTTHHRRHCGRKKQGTGFQSR